jgi:hypothetical protein
MYVKSNSLDNFPNQLLGKWYLYAETYFNIPLCLPPTATPSSTDEYIPFNGISHYIIISLNAFRAIDPDLDSCKSFLEKLMFIFTNAGNLNPKIYETIKDECLKK